MPDANAAGLVRSTKKVLLRHTRHQHTRAPLPLTSRAGTIRRRRELRTRTTRAIILLRAIQRSKGILRKGILRRGILHRDRCTTSPARRRHRVIIRDLRLRRAARPPLISAQACLLRWRVAAAWILFSRRTSSYLWVLRILRYLTSKPLLLFFAYLLLLLGSIASAACRSVSVCRVLIRIILFLVDSSSSSSLSLSSHPVVPSFVHYRHLPYGKL